MSVRGQAAGILAGRKLRMLEEAGLEVVSTSDERMKAAAERVRGTVLNQSNRMPSLADAWEIAEVVLAELSR